MRASTILFLIVLVILLALVGAAGFKVNTLMKQKAEEEAKVVEVAVPVHVTVIGTGTVEDLVALTGDIEAAHRVDVFAKIATPGKLIAAKVKKGDKVRRDQVLATVDRDEVGAVYLAYGVKAPRSGVVVSITDSKGAMIVPTIPVATLIDTETVKVRADLIEADLGRVRIGTPARIRVDAYPDRIFEGTVTRIEPILDALSHTAPIEIEIQNGDGALMPGMFARVQLVADSHSGVPLISKEAVYSREGKHFAFVLDQQKMQLVLTELNLGYYDLSFYEVLDGLKEGDLVVDRDLVVLKDQTKVTVANPPEGWTPPEPSPESDAAPMEGATVEPPPPAAGSTAVDSQTQPGQTP